MTTYRWAGGTDVGRTRTENQDAILPDGPGEGSQAVLAVADGLGGHPGGDIASRCAIDALVGVDPDSEATELVRTAHQAIFEYIVAEMDGRRELIRTLTGFTLIKDGRSRYTESHAARPRA